MLERIEDPPYQLKQMVKGLEQKISYVESFKDQNLSKDQVFLEQELEVYKQKVEVLEGYKDQVEILKA